MPKGSVRSLIALGVVGAFIAGQVDREVVLIVLAFYFTDRATNGSAG